MKAFARFTWIFLAVCLIFSVLLNVYLIRQNDAMSGYYRVEAKRLTDEIRDTGTWDLSKYEYLTGVFTEENGDIYKSENPYVILDIGGKLYRVEYMVNDTNKSIIIIDVFLGVILLLTVLMLTFIRRKIIYPFGRLNEVPQELAKGNLAVEIPEEKSRFFGRFTWGVNMLRESIEDSRKKEISMQRDKKLLLLSLSHDIKTPLSAIKLNAKALAKGLYKDEEKQRSAAESINSRADEIESFVSQITKAASDDFMEFEVIQGEVFLSQVIEKISMRYAPRFASTMTRFSIEEYADCLLSCDPDRLGECIQNLIENAIKYGDGKSIDLRFDKMDGNELITVSNSGCTLDEDELTTIFSSFRRGRNAENIQGNGLGLFICRKLMGLMGGEVYAEINGGRFEVTLVVKLA